MLAQWDVFMEQIEPLASRMPFMLVPGSACSPGLATVSWACKHSRACLHLFRCMLIQVICGTDHERDWPHTGDRYANLANDSGEKACRSMHLLIWVRREAQLYMS